MAMTKQQRASAAKPGSGRSKNGRRVIRGVARPAMGRIIEIHRFLVARRYPNCSTLVREFEVSRQTIMTDIRYMRDQMDLPVEWSQERNGYHYTREVRDFPTGEIAAGELAALFLARHTLGSIQATLLGEKVRNVFSAVLDTMKEKLRFSWSELDHAFSVKAATPRLSELTMFEKVGEALLEHRALGFNYRKAGAIGTEYRRLEPYHLTQVEGCWYVIGRDMDRLELRTFALQRMTRPRALANRFRVPQDFDPDDLLGKAFGIWNDSGAHAEHEVVVELTGYAARMAGERRWHASQKEEWLDPKHERVRVSFRVSRFEDIMRWVLGWGSHARVIRPPDLAVRVRDEAAAQARAHGGNPQAADGMRTASRGTRDRGRDSR
jgi:proteasome accessory factor B